MKGDSVAKDDYFVLAYRLLSYLYGCLKAGEKPDWEYLDYGTKDFPRDCTGNLTEQLNREALAEMQVLFLCKKGE